MYIITVGATKKIVVETITLSQTSKYLMRGKTIILSIKGWKQYINMVEFANILGIFIIAENLFAKEKATITAIILYIAKT